MSFETSTLGVLRQMCTQQDISYVNAECRYALTLLSSPQKIIQENDRTIKKLQQCMINPIFHKYLNEAIAEYVFYKSQEAQNPFINLYRGSSKLLNLNIICELNKALQINKHKIFIITVGAGHMQHISEMLQNIFQFKVVLQKNPVRTRATLNLPDMGSAIKQSEFQNQMTKRLNEHALDLTQFFDEALKAQSIRSKL